MEFDLSELGEPYESYVRAQVAPGRYSDASDVVRDALRHLEDRQSLDDFSEPTPAESNNDAEQIDMPASPQEAK